MFMLKKQMLIFGNKIAPTRWLATPSPQLSQHRHQLQGCTWVSTNKIFCTVVLCSTGSTFWGTTLTQIENTGHKPSVYFTLVGPIEMGMCTEAATCWTIASKLLKPISPQPRVTTNSKCHVGVQLQMHTSSVLSPLASWPQTQAPSPICDKLKWSEVGISPLFLMTHV